MKTNVSTVLRRVIEDKIKLTRKIKKRTIHGHFLYCPGSLRSDGKPVEMFRANLIPGRPHDELLILRERLINEALEAKNSDKEDLTVLLARAGMSKVDLFGWLRRKGSVRSLICEGISYAETWRRCIEDHALKGKFSMPSLQAAERIYRRFENDHPKLALIELWEEPKKIENFITANWREASQAAHKSLFTGLMGWARDNLAVLYPGVEGVEECFVADPQKLIKVAKRGSPPRVILTVDGLNQVIDAAMTNPRDEKYRPSFFLDFETFARPSTEASGGSTDAVRIYDNLALLTVENIITSQGAYGDEICPDGYGYITAPLNKTRKRRGRTGRKVRTVNITPRARAYLQPILQPMLDAGWKHQPFITETATNYAMAKSRLLREIDPLVWVEGIPNPMRYSKARKIANTKDCIRSTVVTFLLLVLRHHKLLKDEDIMDHLRRQMGHAGDSQTMEEFYLSNGRLQEALKWWKHRPPPFTYTIDHQQFRKYRYGNYVKASAAAVPVNAALIKDPKHVAKIIRNRRKARKINPLTGKFFYRRKNGATGLNPAVVNPAASQPAQGSSDAALAQNEPQQVVRAVQDSTAASHVQSGAGAGAAPQPFLSISPSRAKQIEHEQKLRQDGKGYHEEIPRQPGNGATMDSVRPDPLPPADQEVPAF